MSGSATQQAQSQQTHAGIIPRIGGWLFRRRTIIHVPLALAVLLTPAWFARGPAAFAVAGIIFVAAGEAVRIWGVRHIGVISRTRSDRLGPLVASGPFALVRNPLYVGNVALWVGFALSARLVWLAPLFVAVLAFEYHAIVRWEEQLLEERLGDRYRAYSAEVPRWLPRTLTARAADAPLFSWRDTIYSERGTLVAIAVGYILLAAKSRI
jgi:protein-S-isoprenylcysteine O-methyltransferase Ste14